MVQPHLDADRQLDAARAELERRVRAGAPIGAADLRHEFPQVWADPEWPLELVYREYVLRADNGESPQRDDWYARYPEWHNRLERLFGLYDLLADQDTHTRSATLADGPPGPETLTDQPAGYELLGELGRGGMAVVYRARHAALNRIVALKVLHGGAWFSAADAARVRREAAAVARLQHPNIVQIYEIGDWDGVPFLSLEYAPGGSLADALAQARRHGTVGVTPAQAAELSETLARAMHYAHERGVVHRDLKPANVLLSAVGSRQYAAGSVKSTETGEALSQLPTANCLLPTPKIADFGLAVALDAPAAQTATLAGTPAYMAPEQADGRAAGPRADVYALGGILYELLTGRPPFQGATVLETLDLVRHTEPVPPRQLRPGLPRDLETVCLKCLHKSPERRYESAAALADDLARFREGRPIAARPTTALERGVKWVKRRPAVAALTAATLVLAVTLFALTQLQLRASQQARQREAGLRAQETIASARAHWHNNDVAAAQHLLAQCPDEHRDAAWAALHAQATAEVSSVPVTSYGSLHASPSGRFAVLDGFRGGTVLDAHTGAELGTTATVSSLGYQFSFAADERTLTYFPTTNVLAARTRPNGSGGTASISEFDFATRSERRLRSMRIGPRCAASPTGRLATLADATVTVSDVRSDRTLATFDLTAQGACLALLFDPPAEQLVSVHADRVAVWSIDGRALVREHPFQKVDGAQNYALHPDLGTLYFRQIKTEGTRFEDRREGVVAWDLRAGRQLFQTAEGDTILRCKVSPNGVLLAASTYRALHLYDARTGELRATLRGHTRGTPTFDFIAGGRILSFAADNLLKTWDISAWGG